MILKDLEEDLKFLGEIADSEAWERIRMDDYSSWIKGKQNTKTSLFYIYVLKMKFFLTYFPIIFLRSEH